jgi:hypothetical protein
MKNEIFESNMDDIDKLTLELLINKTQYRKFLAKTDPFKSKEYEEYLDDCQKYKDGILSITENLLDDPSLQINTEINEIFETYVKSMIKYLQHKDTEELVDHKDENVMFGESAFVNRSNMYIKPENYTESKERESSMQTHNHSFWGKSIRKTRGDM